MVHTDNSEEFQRCLPYHELVVPLLRSVVRAFAEFPEACFKDPRQVEKLDDWQLNRHFCWLTMHIKDGQYRHLTEGTPDESVHSLFTSSLRAKHKQLPPNVRKNLENHQSIERDEDYDVDGRSFVRKNPTRISKLIKIKVRKAIEEATENHQGNFILPSPLAIILDYLTISEHPGSKSYIFLTLRSFLFEHFKLIPDDLKGTEFSKFSVEGIEQAYSQILTSFRPRYRSRGQDKLDAPEDGTAALLRHFFALQGVLLLRFKSFEQLGIFCVGSKLLPSEKSFEFTRPRSLNKLPELGEVVNSLWGLPIPIRGAETIFRGGLVLSGRGGLVCALHGGPGTGKTSLSLALASSLSAFGIFTVFLTAEETKRDLASRTFGLIPDAVRRLPFFPKKTEEWLAIKEVPVSAHFSDRIVSLNDAFDKIYRAIHEQANSESENSGIPMPCSTAVVLDGLHDIFAYDSVYPNDEYTEKFREFIDKCRKLKALVILTTGDDWESNQQLDYLVDVSASLKHGTEGDSEVSSAVKPGRQIHLAKARNQLCAPGRHGLQIAGQKGVRFTPQSNYVLDRLSIRSAKLPDRASFKKVMQRACRQSDLRSLPTEEGGSVSNEVRFQDASEAAVKIFRRSNVFLNGEGSGGKAGLALKIATAPSFEEDDGGLALSTERVLIVSFLYPQEYYEALHSRVERLQKVEYPSVSDEFRSRIDVIHLYPGHLRPDDLLSRIEWDLRAADLMGDPFTSIVVDGIHNVFLQFPEIEKNSIFWPQLISMLRARDITIIMTHTILAVKGLVDDNRSDPLRHALVLKTDFRFEVDPVDSDDNSLKEDLREEHTFRVETISAIGQPIPNPKRHGLYWSRERLVFFTENQGRLPGV